MEERLRVLKVISEVIGRLNLNEFAQMVGLTSNQTMKHMQELLKAGGPEENRRWIQNN